MKKIVISFIIILITPFCFAADLVNNLEDYYDLLIEYNKTLDRCETISNSQSAYDEFRFQLSQAEDKYDNLIDVECCSDEYWFNLNIFLTQSAFWSVRTYWGPIITDLDKARENREDARDSLEEAWDDYYKISGDNDDDDSGGSSNPFGCFLNIISY